MAKLTDFGKAIRKIRIDRDMNLIQLAESIGVSSAFLSSVETGKKPISAELIGKIITTLQLEKEDEKILIHSASQSIRNVTIKTKSAEEAEIAFLFALRMQAKSIKLDTLRKFIYES